jgi:Mrp family chromosome partitioning ATPase
MDEHADRISVGMALAREIADEGRRVVLLDVDGSGNCLTSRLNLVDAPGLSDVVYGEKLPRCVRAGLMPGVDVLPSGQLSARRSAMLNEPAFAEVMHKLTVAYDHAILLAPPLTKDESARIAAAFCDGSLLVESAESVTVRGVGKSMHLLRSVGAHILGCVLLKSPVEV